MNMRYLGIVATIAVCLALAGPAAAVNYTVAGWGPTQFLGPHAPPEGAPWGPNGYPGDTVQLVTYTGTLNLAPGTSVQKINTLLWTVDYTYAGTDDDWTNDATGDWLQLQFPINAARKMSFVGGCAGSLSQTGLLEVLWSNDYLAVNAGSTSTFFIPGYQIDVTPLAVARKAAVFPSGPPWVQPSRDMTAQFVVTEVPIPEPVTMAGLMLGIGSVVTYVRKRRTA